MMSDAQRDAPPPARPLPGPQDAVHGGVTAVAIARPVVRHVPIGYPKGLLMKLETPSRFLRALVIVFGVAPGVLATAQDVTLPVGAAPAAVPAPLAGSEPVPMAVATPVVQPVPVEELTQMDDSAFLTEWQKRCFAYFWEQADPATGLVADRAPADGSRRYDRATHDPDAPDAPVASIAAVGFGLTAICIADERGWIDGDAAYERVATTLRFLLNEAEHVEGFFYHFMEMHDGRRAWASELSSIDTALLMAGVLTARQYYPDTEVASLAIQLYDRVNWPWMMNDGLTLSMGWSPEDGFIEYRWDHFSEHLVMQVLGLGSTTHPLPPAAWHNWQRGPIFEYEGGRFMSYPPLFVHQFSHAWVDFRDKRDDYADYWANSVFATKAHRAMFTRLAERFPLYGETLWGVTSSDSAMGYTAWGGPSPSPHIDGTVVPCAAAGSIPFAPGRVHLRRPPHVRHLRRPGVAALRPRRRLQPPHRLVRQRRHRHRRGHHASHDREPPQRVRLGLFHAEPRGQGRDAARRLPRAARRPRPDHGPVL